MMRLEEHVACTGDENLNKDLDLNARIIPKQILKK
jgi:hypothetical protein